MRFYTYASTMMLCLEAAADAGIEFVVLDRPNPLGGDLVEGRRRDPRDEVPASLVSTRAGPARARPDAGEMAQVANAARAKPAKLTVVPMEGWRRSMSWRDTGRAWVSPSPNLRTAEAALAYPGTALLEGTSASEGRGTEAPFLLLGAPWMKPEAIIPTLANNGLTLETATFTPTASPAALDPKYKDQPCAGIRIAVKDAAAVQPYKLGVALLLALEGPAGIRMAPGRSRHRLAGGDEEAARGHRPRRSRRCHRGLGPAGDRGVPEGTAEGAAVLTSCSSIDWSPAY